MERGKMKLDIESSICGLWLSPGRAGYLGSWFPRLRNKNGNFIPIAPGLNVFYGRNGAGKTQILQAIAHTAEFKMSAYEGFVLKQPKISENFRNYFRLSRPCGKFCLNELSKRIPSLWNFTVGDAR